MSRHLIFLPGAGGDPSFWRPLGELLPAEWRKTYLGWPGLGNQPPCPDVRGFDDVVTLVERQLPTEPADLLAQSMGGAVALRVARRNPHHVRRLVLAATSGGLDVATLGGEDWRPAYRSAFPNAARWITEARLDLTAELNQVFQPTLLLWGDADPISPIAVGERLRALLRDAAWHVVANGDHSFANEQPRQIRDVICRHLA